MYRMAKIVERMSEEKDRENSGKNLADLINNGFHPDIQGIKSAFQDKHGYSSTIARNTYNDLYSNNMIKEYDKILPGKDKKPLKFKSYVELNTSGRNLTDTFGIPWGLLKAYVSEYGLVVTTLMSLGFGIVLSGILRLVIDGL